MIGTIRKHSKWMWGIVITATIGSFLYWGSGNPTGGDGNYSGRDSVGEIQGRPVTRQEYSESMREMDLRFFFSSGSWPDSETARRGFDPQRESFFRVLLLRKAEQLQIHASLDATAKAANELLRGMSRGAPVPLAEFVSKLLAPRGLTGADFERYIHNEIIITTVTAFKGSIS